MLKPKYLVSACLAGVQCRYDGKSNYNARVADLVQAGLGVLVCPEQMGGLPTPRIPCEIINDKVINKYGVDKTVEFVEGATQTLDKGIEFNIHKAILKSNSPSCGRDCVYDGNFNGTLVPGKGVTARLLENNGFVIFTEKDRPLYDVIIVAAGSGSRSGLDYNKVFYHNSKEMVIEHTIKPFLSDYRCGMVIIVCKDSERPMLEACLPNYKIIYASGGKCREESVYNGMRYVNAPYVLVHDAARPNVSEKLIDSIVKELEQGAKAVVPYLDLDEGTINDYKVGDKAIQTPQAYKTLILSKTLSKIEGDLDKHRDESSIISKHTSIEIVYISGNRKNYKLTTIEDLERWAEESREDE